MDGTGTGTRISVIEEHDIVRVAAVSVGRLLDLTLRAGRHPAAAPPLPQVLGAEHAGAVAALDPATAACLALANQLQQAGFRPGDWVLVQGAASDLGSLTAAFAAHLGGSVIDTSRSAWKRLQFLELGLIAALDPLSPSFVAEVLALTAGSGVAVAIDDLGEPQLWDATMEVPAAGGTVVSSGAFLGGRVTIDLRRLYLGNQRIIGVRTGNAGSAAALWAEVERGVVLSTATSEDWN